MILQSSRRFLNSSLYFNSRFAHGEYYIEDYATDRKYY